MKLTAPDDRSFPNGPSYEKGAEVDVAALAAALGRDPKELADDLTAQGWGAAKPKKATAKKAAAETSPASGDDPAPSGADTEGA